MRSVCLSDELAGIRGCFASVFVLEIGVHIHALAKPAVEAFPPDRDLLRSVIFEAQAGVGKAGREHLWRCLFVGFGQAKRRLILAKDGVRFLGVPRRVTYFKCKMERRRAKSKKVFQQGTIELERGGQLDEHRAKVVAIVQHTGDFQETLQSAFAVAEPLNVSDLLVGLQGEAKAFGNSFRPLQEQILCRHAIETVIDFDRRELLGVEGEHFTVWKFLGVKTSLPLFIRVSRSPNKKPTCARNGCTSVPWHLITATTPRKGRGRSLPSRRFLGSRRQTIAEKLDGLL